MSAPRSPCINVCALDRRTGWCLGCGRTAAEIRGWKKAQPHQSRKVLADLPRRLAKLKSRRS